MKLYFEREQLKWDFAKLSLSVREQLKSNCAGNGGRRQTKKENSSLSVYHRIQYDDMNKQSFSHGSTK